MVSADSNPYLQGLSSPEPADRSRSAAHPPADGLDDLFDYDAGMDDAFHDVDTSTKAPVKGKTKGGRKGGNGLGIDEEIQVTKTRRVNVKLDENRLLSQAGIPKLRRISKERLRFKGKGHEVLPGHGLSPSMLISLQYSDVTRLLSLYQLWLDDLYPKAKFADALAIIEKLGHTKRMQTMRREWIDESKGRSATAGTSAGADIDIEPVERGSGPGDAGARITPPEPPTTAAERDSEGPQTPPVNPVHEEGDLYSASPSAARVGRVLPPVSGAAEGPPEEDDLDILLAEDFGEAAATVEGPSLQKPTLSREAAPPPRDDFDDDMEAMAEMEGMW
ncbi:MAG: chromosome segregation in meiosis- protein [Thelocarpon impressellum]|nr:MAG: chromosome segregation in meiosis- protein [Thelocarpon impressellum]